MYTQLLHKTIQDVRCHQIEGRANARAVQQWRRMPIVKAGGLDAVCRFGAAASDLIFSAASIFAIALEAVIYHLHYKHIQINLPNPPPSPSRRRPPPRPQVKGMWGSGGGGAVCAGDLGRGGGRSSVMNKEQEQEAAIQ